MRVIFWDIDGVLNHPGVWGAWAKLGWASALDPDMVKLARDVVRETGAKCVLSSSWRIGDGYGETLVALEKQGWQGVHDDFIDCTPHLGTKRGIEIGQWLLENPEVKEYVIVDDDRDMTTHMKRLVHIKGSRGITPDDCERIKRRFELEPVSPKA